LVMQPVFRFINKCTHMIIVHYGISSGIKQNLEELTKFVVQPGDVFDCNTLEYSTEICLLIQLPGYN